MPSQDNVSDLIGIPWKVHGRDEGGLDCFGLVYLIAQRNGTPIQDPVYKGFDPTLMKMAESIGLVKVDRLEVGTVLEIEKDGRLHLGYALDTERMIHCTYNEGVIVQNIVDYKIKGYYIFNGCT